MQKKLGSVQNWSAYQINRIFDSRHILFTRYHSSFRREAKSRQSSCLGSSYSIIMRELLSFKHISFWHMKMDSKLNLEIASKENSWNSLTYKFAKILRVQFGKSKNLRINSWNFVYIKGRQHKYQFDLTKFLWQNSKLFFAFNKKNSKRKSGGKSRNFVYIQGKQRRYQN